MLWAVPAAELEGMTDEVLLEFTPLRAAQPSSAVKQQW